jgi:hypothetical protein
MPMPINARQLAAEPVGEPQAEVIDMVGPGAQFI